MTRKEREDLQLAWAWDKEEFCWRIYREALANNWDFVAKAADAVKTRKSYKWDFLDSGVQVACEDLYRKHGNNVTTQMIRNAVDPAIPSKRYSEARKRLGIKVKRSPGGRPRKTIPETNNNI